MRAYASILLREACRSVGTFLPVRNCLNLYRLDLYRWYRRQVSGNTGYAARQTRPRGEGDRSSCCHTTWKKKRARSFANCIVASISFDLVWVWLQFGWPRALTRRKYEKCWIIGDSGAFPLLSLSLSLFRLFLTSFSNNATLAKLLIDYALELQCGWPRVLVRRKYEECWTSRDSVAFSFSLSFK